MKRLTYLLPALLLMLCACKPTEKNYRAAYEAAQAKKAAEREADGKQAEGEEHRSAKPTPSWASPSSPAPRGRADSVSGSTPRTSSASPSRCMATPPPRVPRRPAWPWGSTR